jgi:hypothetical protein
MLFIEDFLQEPEPAGETPSVYANYQAGAYNQNIYKNSGNASVPTPPPAPAKGPIGPPRQYGPDVVIHKKGADYAGEEQRGVEYTPLAQRVLNYKVVVAGKMTRGTSFEVLDTPSFKMRAVKEFGASNIGNATLDQQASQNGLAVEWARNALIWVCVPIDAKDAKQSVFYSHVCRPGAFHHSSLAGGREVLGGGEWIVESGKLKKISANSGHYQPSLGSLHQCVLALAPAWQPDTTVFLWNKDTRLWEDVPVNAFAKDATGGGKYKAHPRSV